MSLLETMIIDLGIGGAELREYVRASETTEYQTEHDVNFDRIIIKLPENPRFGFLSVGVYQISL